MGQGELDGGTTREPGRPPAIYLRVAASGFDSGAATVGQKGGAGVDTADRAPGVAGNGTHRLRLTWDNPTQRAVFEIDANYTGGEFVADHVFPACEGSFTGVNLSNSIVFFGG